jgi:peptidoglycan hydrolase CwlO-like protein
MQKLQKNMIVRCVCVAILFVSIVVAHKPGFIFAQTPTETPTPTPTVSVTPTTGPDPEKQKELSQKIQEYEETISKLQDTADTLNSQIKLVDNQIAVAELRVQDTEEKIAQLEGDIEIAQGKILGLEDNIEDVTDAMINRVSAVYAVGKIDPLQMLLTSHNVENFLTRLKYLQIVQLYDKRQIYAAEQARVNYEQEKTLFEDKQVEAESLREQLAKYNEQLESEKVKKRDLLTVTNNDEKKYQQLLAQTRAEFEAIQGIIAGKGTETEVYKVGEGDRIASIIQGASCNSSGTHLHFIVRSGGASQDPFSFLSGIDHTNNSGGDSFEPRGSWRWPIDPTVKFNQGYGVTSAVRSRVVWYNFHDGIDISTTGSQSVKAVKSGMLYQGSYSGNGGCRLKYVRVKHDEGGQDTLYLHVNY